MKELNDTGSFPDESERTPMCFIKCILEGAGILSKQNDINKEKTLEAYKLDNDDLVDDCVIEMGELEYSAHFQGSRRFDFKYILAATRQNDSCLIAYFFVRCLMTRSLLDNLGLDNDSLK